MKYGSITTGIIADGLVFNMDAANRASYIPNATIVFNTTNTSISGNLEDGVGFDNTNQGSFTFDGVDDKIPSITGLSQLTDTFSISQWFYKNTSGYSITFSAYAGSNQYFNNGSAIDLNSNGTITFYNGSNRTTTSSQYTTEAWYYLVVTSNGATVEMYVNGSSVALDSNSAASRNWTQVFLASYYYSGAKNNFNGKLGPTHIYNRALSANEVLHNYNALKGRFGL